MKRFKEMIVLIILILGLASIALGDDVITLRLSYKVVLNPANGNRPLGVTDADLDNAVAGMNILLQTYFRGYRVQRVGTITNVGGVNDTTGPSIYYNTNFFANNGGALKDQMEAAAIANPTTYAWNVNAINIYITNGICGGICSFPTENDDIIIIGGCSDDDEETQLHEIGHYFNLFHTQGEVCGCCNATQTGQCHTTPGDDHIADTLPDLARWNRDDIAQIAESPGRRWWWYCLTSRFCRG